MTNKELWDVMMELYQSKHSKDTALVISSIDDHFNCYFNHLEGQLHFRITVQNNFFSMKSFGGGTRHVYSINNIYYIKNTGAVTTVSESKLKEYLIPIVRDAKLNLLGI